MPAYRVYISSTQQDLEPERQNLKTALEQAGYDPQCMEKYPAFSNRPKDKCQSDVRKSHIYVVIIGERYGSLPIMPDGSSFPRSFTECEYEAAMEAKIPVLVFIKKIARDPNDASLNSFIQRLRTSHGIDEFIDADELSKQVLIAITIQTGKSTRKGLNPTLKYYCNRNEQANRFDENYYQLKCDQQIHFYLLTGHEMDYHMSFVSRYKCEFKAKSNDEEPVEISFHVKINPADNEARLVQTIKELLNGRIRSKYGNPLAKVDANSLFELLNTLNKKFLFINLNVQSSYIKPSFADVYKKSIEKFYEDFTSSNDLKYQDKKIIIFLNLIYLDNFQNAEVLRVTFEENPFYADKKLPALTKVSIDDIKEWLDSNDIVENPKIANDIINKYFRPLADADSNSEFFMADAEIEMEKVIEAFNN